MRLWIDPNLVAIPKDPAEPGRSALDSPLGSIIQQPQTQQAVFAGTVPVRPASLPQPERSVRLVQETGDDDNSQESSGLESS